jgi:hypothetical protein
MVATKNSESTIYYVNCQKIKIVAIEHVFYNSKIFRCDISFSIATKVLNKTTIVDRYNRCNKI